VKTIDMLQFTNNLSSTLHNRQLRATVPQLLDDWNKKSFSDVDEKLFSAVSSSFSIFCIYIYAKYRWMAFGPLT
jgi:hypothetical protein